MTFFEFKSTSSYRARPLALSTKINTFYDLNPLAHIELDQRTRNLPEHAPEFKSTSSYRARPYDRCYGKSQCYLNPLAHIELDIEGVPVPYDHLTI